MRKRKKMTPFQAIFLLTLWLILLYIVIAYSKKIDGPTIVMLIISGILVLVPIYKSLRKKDE